MTLPRVRLGDLLVDARIISREQLDEVLALQQRDPRRLGTLLVESGLVSETQVTQILSQQLSVPWVSLHHIDFSPQLLKLVPCELAQRHCLVPIFVRRVRGIGETVYVAMDDPDNEEALAQVSKTSGLPVRAMIAPPSHIRAAIASYYAELRTTSAQASERSTPSEAAPADEPRVPEPVSEPADIAPSESLASATPEETHAPGEPVHAPGEPVDSSTTQSRVQPVDPMEPARPPDAGDGPEESMPAGAAQSFASNATPERRAPEREAAPAPEAALEPQATPAAGAASETEFGPTVNGGATPATRRSGSEGTAPEAGESRRSSDSPESAPEIEAREIPLPRQRPPVGRMVTLTLLDGTQVNVPVRGARARREGSVSGDAPAEPVSQHLAEAIRALAGGREVTTLADSQVRWDRLFSALLRVLLEKKIVTESELLAALEKR